MANKKTVEETQAQMTMIEGVIGTGHDAAKTRKQLCKITGLPDRALRKLIEMSDLPIINVGYGYYIPDPEDEIDQVEKAEYIAQERSRILAMNQKLSRKFGEEPEER